MTKLKVTLAVALLLLNGASADQPVHCVRDQLFGEWYFHVAKEEGNVNLYETSEICSHNIPNKIQLVNTDHKFAFGGQDTYKLNLMDDFKAEAVICRNTAGLQSDQSPGNCDKQLIKGHWTAIYDQALNIELDNGQRFITNLRYNIKKDVTQDPLVTAQSEGTEPFELIETGDYDKFDSDCTRTMVGFVQNIPKITGEQGGMKNHKVHCFHGQMVKPYEFEKSEPHDNGKLKWSTVTQHNAVKTVDLVADSVSLHEHEHKHHHHALPGQKNKNGIRQSLIENGSGHERNHHIKGKKAKKRGNLHLQHEPSDETDLLIEAVNAADLGWKADVCKYTKTHPNYGSHCDDEPEQTLLQLDDGLNDMPFSMDMSLFEEMSVDDISAALQGLDQMDKNEFGNMEDPKFKTALEKAQKYQKGNVAADDIPDEDLPEKLDWREFEGFDFTSYLRDQAHCGSCYTLSFTQVMEARLKLKYGKQPNMLSPQQLLTCNYMNEGCDGGWPHFNIILAENAHLVSEKCAPYKQMTKGDQCHRYESCQPEAKIAQSYQVGGGWGATSERKLMKEILRNGPINGDFQAPKIFGIYREGVFAEKGLIDIHREQQEAIQLAQQKLQEGLEVPNDTTANDNGVSWVEMNHSVVIIGWGYDEDTNTPYWIVRNSYGPNWGMNGDFFVKRGGNDFGMEVENIAFEPLMCSDDSTPDQCNIVA